METVYIDKRPDEIIFLIEDTSAEKWPDKGSLTRYSSGVRTACSCKEEKYGCSTCTKICLEEEIHAMKRSEQTCFF